MLHHSLLIVIPGTVDLGFGSCTTPVLVSCFLVASLPPDVVLWLHTGAQTQVEAAAGPAPALQSRGHILQQSLSNSISTSDSRCSRHAEPHLILVHHTASGISLGADYLTFLCQQPVSVR
jgi:hypothetical protein